MTEALMKYRPVFAPDDGTGGGADGDVIEKPDADAAAKAAAEAEAAKGGGDDKGGKTVLEDAGTDKEVKPTWGDDWRDRMAKGDEAASKALARYTTPEGVAKALVAAQRAISEGKNAKLPERPTDPKDEKGMAEWRKAMGVPDEPAGYKLPDDVTKALTDADKPILANFTEFAHKEGMRGEDLAIAAKWYVENQRAAAELQSQQDTEHKEACEDKLRADWGPEFKANTNLAIRFLDDSPLIHTGWAGLRDESGRMLGSDPEFMNWAAQMGREKFGDAVFASSDAAAKHDNRRAEIEKIRDTDFERYEREGLDKEMRAIIEKDLARKK